MDRKYTDKAKMIMGAEQGSKYIRVGFISHNIAYGIQDTTFFEDRVFVVDIANFTRVESENKWLVTREPMINSMYLKLENAEERINELIFCTSSGSDKIAICPQCERSEKITETGLCAVCNARTADYYNGE